MSDSVEFKASIGTKLTDKYTGITGTVRTQCKSRHDQGYWLEGRAENGQPIQHYVDERDALAEDGAAL
jgi:hypothetical protein